MARRAEIQALGAFLFMACGPLPVHLADSAQSFQSRDYERIFDQWTRETQAYNLDTLENALTVSSTYRSWEFRQAWVQRYAEDYRLTDEEVAALLDEQWEEHEAGHQFLVATTATKTKWADLAREDSPWVVALINDRQQEMSPRSIERVEDCAQMLTYYPFISVFRSTFLITFPRTLPDGADILDPKIGSFSLLFSGALGKAELVWKVAKP